MEITNEDFKNELISFCRIKDSNGVERPTVDEINSLCDKLSPIRRKAEKDITDILQKISEEHSIHIWVDYKRKAKLTFIYPCSNFKEV